MIKSVSLPILFDIFEDDDDDEDDDHLSKIILQNKVENTSQDTYYVTFFRIDNIHEDPDNPEHTIVNSAGDSYLCVWNLDKVLRFINKFLAENVQ